MDIAFSVSRDQDAVDLFRKALQRNPRRTRARFWVIASLVRLGRVEEAARETEELSTIARDFCVERMRFGIAAQNPSLLDRLLSTVARVGLGGNLAHLDRTNHS